MLFNGIDLTPYLRIKEIRGRGMMGNELSLLSVPGMPGAHLSRTDKPPRILEIEADVRSDSRENLRIKIDQLNGILAVKEPVPIIFPDEPNITYYGVPETTSEDNEYTFLHQGQLIIVCPDPYKYGRERVATFPTETVTLDNLGSSESDPIFELEVQQPTTFAMIQNQDNEYMMIGRPVDVDSIAFEEREQILHDTMSSTVGWTTGTQVDDGIVTGSMASQGNEFVASDFGSSDGQSNWHGPALKKSLTEQLQDFRMDVLIENMNSASGVGRVDVYLLDVNNQIVGSMRLVDLWNNVKRNRSRVFAQSGDEQHHLMWYETGQDDSGEIWNDFDGILRLERNGNEWLAYIGKIRDDGTHHARRIVRWTDSANQFMDKVAQVQVYIGKHKDYEPTQMSVKDLKVWKINNPDEFQIPYIAYPGDKITFDHTENGEVLINGENFAEVGLGADFFQLQKGLNQLVVQPSDTFEVSVRYRERFR